MSDDQEYSQSSEEARNTFSHLAKKSD